MHSIWSRQTCLEGACHVCHDDFTGCCSIDSPGTICSCPNATSSNATVAEATTSAPTKELLSTVAVVQTSRSCSRHTKTASSLPNTNPSGHALAVKTKSVRDVSVTADANLACPASNATLYTDSNHNTYEIHCSQDNSYTSYDTVTIAAGGFSSCFASCDNLTACAGFTYVGLDGGSCYLKQAMPGNLAVVTAGSNYVSCVRVNSSAPNSTSSGSPTQSATASSIPKNHPGPGKGAIAGAIVGGIVAVLLVLLLIGILIRKRRQKMSEARTSTKTGTFHEPVEYPGKQEVFAPYGGFYREGLVAREGLATGKSSTGLYQTHDRSYTPTNHQPQAINELDDSGPVMLDGQPIYSTSFREPPLGIAEMADTSPVAIRNVQTASVSYSESPTVGRVPVHAEGACSGLGIQHTMSWNEYDDRAAMSRPSFMSPGMSPTIVSPPDEGPSHIKGNLTRQSRVSPVHTSSSRF